MANKIPIKVNGLPEALAKLKKYQSRKKKQIKVELEKGGRQVELLAKQTVPVDTTRLKSSIAVDLGDLGVLIVRVGTDVKYAPYVEFGTKFMGARPYLYPSFFTYENEIVKAIGRVLRKDIGLK